MSRHAVLLVGSARPTGQSTSEALGRYLLRGLEPAGFTASVLFAARVRSREALARLAAEIAAAELFVLATPLYVDALPYLVTAAFEALAEARQGEAPASCRFAAIVNCGFPEAAHTRLALDICRIFARQAHLDYAGGLGLGGGETLGGRSPERLGWLTRHVTRALDLSARALADGRPIPAKAVELMARPLVPARGYTMLGELGFRRRARHFGAEKRLDDRPFERPA